MPDTLKLYETLRQALRTRQQTIADRSHYEKDPAGHLEQLKRVSLQIVEAGSILPPPVDPQLKHYLERCSYDKALAWLDDACADKK
ncbi:MAG: hypothetical protein ABI615_11975 [Chthoniobacterales bacterium]